jgi:DNA-binding transcriptional MocR family regulator
VEPELARLARAELDADAVPSGPLAVTSGSLDAIERVLAAHLKPGDTVAVEDPGWGSLLDLVPALGLRTVPVGVDDEGPLPDDVRRALDGGARALRSVLRNHPSVLLVEDDHGHGIVDLPLHPLAGTTRDWAFVRSVAKAYGPDLRLAVLTGDDVTVDRVRGRQRLGPGWVPRLLQRAVVRLWTDAAPAPTAAATAYGRRRDLLIEALADRGITAHGRSGLNVWIPVPDETGAVARLLHAGWAVAPGARFRMSAPPGIRITVSTLDTDETESLADAVAEAVGPAPARGYM